MASRIWPAFMCEPEYARELEQAEADALAQAFEDEDFRRANDDEPYAYFPKEAA